MASIDMTEIPEVIAADGCDDGVYEPTTVEGEDEVFAQAWFSFGHTPEEIDKAEMVYDDPYTYAF